LLVAYYESHPIEWRTRYQQDDRRSSIQRRKLQAEAFVTLGPGPEFGPGFIDQRTKQRIELFKNAAKLHQYFWAVPALLKRIDDGIELYRSDRPASFRRTLNPRKMAIWLYDSMEQVAQEASYALVHARCRLGRRAYQNRFQDKWYYRRFLRNFAQ
jgi:hypothetical protein